MCRELREVGMSGIRLYMGDLFVSSRVQVGTVIARYLYALGPVPNAKIAEQSVASVNSNNRTTAVGLPNNSS